MLTRSQNVLKLLLAGLAGSALAAGLLSPGSASANIGICRTDPVITLTNGAAIDIQAAIADSASDVTRITYVVHGPAGTAPLAIVKSDGILGLTETLKYYADQPKGTFTSDTTVLTHASGVSVQPMMTVVSVLGLALGSKSTSGLSGQTLHLQLAGLVL